jgi:hypothetical protein
LNEDSGDAIFAIIGIEVNDSPVDNAIRNRNGVTECARAKVSVKLNAFIAIRRKGRWKASIHEREIGCGLQSFQSKWRFEFPEAQRSFLPVSKVRISFLNDDIPAPEIRHDAEVDVLVNGALDNRSNSTEYESARIDLVRAEEKSSIGLDVAAKTKLKIVVRRTDRKPITARINGCGRCRFCRGGVLIQFALPADNAELLIECFQPLRHIHIRARSLNADLSFDLSEALFDGGDSRFKRTVWSLC